MTTTTISAGQTSTGLNIGSGDLLNISSGGTAINTTDNGEELVFSGGVASSTTVNSGGVENVSGGTTVSTIVTADGEVVVYAGGTTPEPLPVGPPPSADELADRAVATGDEHAVKLTEACLRLDGVTPDPLLRHAAARAAELLG